MNQNARTHGKYCAEARHDRETARRLISLLMAPAVIPDNTLQDEEATSSLKARCT